MKKFTRAGKKALSVFLAALMVMTAWVFVAPEKAEAIDSGKYYVRITYEVEDPLEGGDYYNMKKHDKPYQGKSSVDTFDDCNVSGMSLFYKDNHGTGSEYEVWWNLGQTKKVSSTTDCLSWGSTDSRVKNSDITANKNLWASKSGNAGDGTATAVIPGFPTGLYVFNDNSNWNNGCKWKIKKLEVKSDSGQYKTIWNGAVYAASNWNCHWALLKAAKNGSSAATINTSGSDSSDGYAKTDGNGNNWVFPYADSITWGTNPADVITPTDSSKVERNVLSYCKDQYGVRLATEPTYIYACTGDSTSKTGIKGISQTTQPANCPYKFEITKDALLSTKGQNKRKVTVTAKYTYNGKTVNSPTQSFNVTDPSYKITFDGNGGSVIPASYNVYYGESLNSQSTYDGNVSTYPESGRRDGYTWIGMFDAKTGGNLMDPDENVTAAKTYYAHWDVNKYVAVFWNRMHDEVVHIENNIPYGADITSAGQEAASKLPAEYDEAYHYNFTGWDTTLTYITGNKVNIWPKYTAVKHTFTTSTVPANCAHGAGTEYRCTECGYTRVESTGSPTGNHTWDNTYTITKEPTCTATGEGYKTCTVCGAHGNTETISATGHSYKVEKTPASCTKTGSIKYTCTKCGHVETDTLPMTAHNMQAQTKVAATCTSAAYTPYKCANCSFTYNVYDNTQPAIGHSWGDWTVSKAATNTTDGEMKRVCSKNSAHVETVTIPKGEHAFSTMPTSETAATCHSTGTQVFKCTKHTGANACGVEITVTTAKLAHNFKTTKTDAKCTTAGSVVTTCQNSGCTETITTSLPALGHNYGAGTVKKEATCTEAGTIEHTCTRSGCGAKMTDTIPAKGHTTVEVVTDCTSGGTIKCSVCKQEIGKIPEKAHDYTGEEKTILAAGCTTRGVKTIKCKHCDAVKTELIPAKGTHSWGGWTTLNPETCTTDRVEQRVCSVCQQLETWTVPNTKGHKWSDVTTDITATCKSAGVKSKHCSRCDARTDVTVIPALDHTWGEPDVTAATCTTDGVKTYTCSNCSTPKTEVIPKLGHNFVAGTPVAATCKSSGYTPYYCSRNCGVAGYNVIGDNAKADAHDWKVTTSQNGTKLAVAWLCENCGATGNETIDVAEGHNYVDATVTKQPTCTTKGTVTIACDKKHDASCTSVVTATLPVNPDAHSKIKTTVTNPTCTENGKVTTVCEACNEAVYAEQTIPAKGHSYTTQTEYVASTCNKKGYVIFKCANCTDTHNAELELNPDAHKFTKKANGHHDATCTTPAYDEYVCEHGCGETYNKYDGSSTVKAHVWKFTTSKTGTTLTVTCKCENCDASHTQTIDVAEGHNYVDATVTKQPTCKETGTVTIACDKKHDANCTSVVTATLPVNSNAHDKLKTTVTPATCEANGTATTVCESCGNTIGESVTIAELGHNYVGGKETVKTATCETDGVKTVQCTRSGCSHTTEVTIPKTGHSWDGGTLHPADCTHGAYTTYKCSNCNKTYDAVAADAKALGHDWNDWVIINPTNDKAGSVTHTCNRCSEIETVEIPAQGHTFDATKYTETPATCTKKGSRTYKCTAHENCGVSVTVDTDLAQHSYELKYSEKATCTKDGKVVMECSVCGNSKTIDIPKFGHTWNEGEVTKAATCTEEGVKTFTCSTCGETRTEKIAKLQHDFVPGEEVLPTCKDGGKSGYIPYTCSGCDESYVKLTDKNAEHKWGSFATVQEANESRCGIEKRTCSECGAVDYKFTDATGEHTYKDEVTKAATCTEEGSLTRHCTNPNHTGEKDQVLPIAALGHDMKAGKPVDATCEHEGYTDYACLRDNCDFTYRIVTAPEAGHTASGWTVVVPATCTTEGVEKQTCTVCEEILNERTIKATDHSTKTVTKDATCLEPSMSYTYCTTCNMLIGEVTVRNALGHNFVEDAEQYVAPTNSKNGKKVLECSRCGETITVTIPAEGHKFELVSKVDATCNKTGLETYKCKTHTGENDCGLSYTNVIPKKEHTYATKVETEATCTTGGEGAYYCLYCNKIFGRYYIAPFGHDLIKDEAGSKDATCNSVGYDTYKCSRDCGETKVVYRSTLGSHKWGDWELIQAADETHPEIKVRKCSVCNLYEYRTEPPTGEHDYDEGVVTKAPTCTEPGVKTFTCRRTHCACTPGNEKTYTVKIAPTGHKAKIDKKDATCAEAGYIKVVCTVCKNEIGERITLEQKKHIYQSKVTSEPTCSKEGVRTYTCALCGDSYTETIATISHDYQQTERRVAPTCTTDGFDVYECKYCGKESFVKTAEKLGHTEKTITIAATCTTKGSKTVVCSVCNTILKETEYTSALGHKWGEWKATVPGTCAVEGQKTRECSRCHDTETVSTGTGEHVYPAEGVVTPATCTADGFTTYTCTVCKKHSVIKDYTPKLGHKYSADYKIIVQPTCHSTGAKAHYCVRCGAFEAEHDHSYVPLPRLAHTYGEWVVETEPTCDTNGVKKRTCTGCTDKDEGHTQTELIGKIGHNYGEWEVTKKATCVEEGSQRRYCDRCKTWEVQATPKGGHNRVADYAVEATCTAPGKTAGSHCSICGYVFVAQQEVPMKEHMDLNGDGRCEGCGKTMYSPSGKTDSCLCHGTGFRALIYKFVLIIWKIFKINKNCVCGAEHY